MTAVPVRSVGAAPTLVPRRPSRWGTTVLGVAAAALVVVAFLGLDISWQRLASFPQDVAHYSRLMFSDPDWSKLGQSLFQTWRSVAMAWVGAVLGIVVATPLGFLAAKGIGPLWMRGALRGLFALIRAVPEIIIAIVILSVTGLTPFTGALALAVGGVGTLGKWSYEAIEATPGGTSEAVKAAGGGTLAVMRWGLWPQVAPEFMSFWLYRFEINVRTSALLGLIGVGGIGDMLTSYTQYRKWDTVGVLVIVVVVVTMVIDFVSGAVRRRIMEGARHDEVDGH